MYTFNIRHRPFNKYADFYVEFVYFAQQCVQF